MATAFKIPYKTCQAHIAELEKMKKITGVRDDQGAFVYITPDEMSNIANKLTENGKTSMDEVSSMVSEIVKRKV